MTIGLNFCLILCISSVLKKAKSVADVFGFVLLLFIHLFLFILFYGGGGDNDIFFNIDLENVNVLPALLRPLCSNVPYFRFISQCLGNLPSFTVPLRDGWQ